MKKCPKCGTVLDDSKKTCYMCGTVLNNNSPLNFGDTFDNQIGATVTKGQDNVFNNVKGINQKNVGNFQSSGTTNLFKDQFNNLNSIQYDERTALEKIFSDDSRFKSKDEINAMGSVTQNNLNNSDKSKGVYTGPNNMASSGAYVQQNDNSVVNQNYNNINNNNVNNNANMQMPFNNKNNQQINWGDNLKDTDKKVKFHLSLTFIFNLISFVLFVGVMIFVYFNYFKPKKDANIEFGGLVYSINSDFILKKDDKFNRYYTMGEDCTISITYGQTNDVDGFVSSYFDEVRDLYEDASGYTISTEELKINGNTWQELNVIKLQENPSGTGGYSTDTKFKYIAMVYKGTYYDIRYSNQQSDGTCSAHYDNFINSLRFKEEKEED